jgi:hypothetical protein
MGQVRNREIGLHSRLHGLKVPNKLIVTVVIHLIQTTQINKEPLGTKNESHTWRQLVVSLRMINIISAFKLENQQQKAKGHTGNSSKPTKAFQGGSLQGSSDGWL